MSKSRKERLRKDARLMCRQQRYAVFTKAAKAGYDDLSDGDRAAIRVILYYCSRSAQRNLMVFLDYARWFFEDHGFLQPEDRWERCTVYLLASMGLFQVSDDGPLSADAGIRRIELVTVCDALEMDPGAQFLSCLKVLKQKIPGFEFSCWFDGEENEQAGIAYNFAFRCTALQEGESEAK